MQGPGIHYLLLKDERLAGSSIHQKGDDTMVCEDHYLVRCRESEAELSRSPVATSLTKGMQDLSPSRSSGCQCHSHTHSA